MPEQAQTSQLVRVKKEHRVAVVTLDHPPVNALSPALLKELCSLLDHLENDNDARVLTITGSSSYAVGADAGWSAELRPNAGLYIVYDCPVADNGLPSPG